MVFLTPLDPAGPLLWTACRAFMDGKAEQGLCRIDTAWGHCADKWELLALDGTVLGSRPLHLKPFRGRTPDDIPRVTVRAHDSVHAYGGRTLAVELPR